MFQIKTARILLLMKEAIHDRKKSELPFNFSLGLFSKSSLEIKHTFSFQIIMVIYWLVHRSGKACRSTLKCSLQHKFHLFKLSIHYYCIVNRDICTWIHFPFKPLQLQFKSLASTNITHTDILISYLALFLMLPLKLIFSIHRVAKYPQLQSQTQLK